MMQTCFKIMLVVLTSISIWSCQGTGDKRFERFPSGLTKEKIDIEGLVLADTSLELSLVAAEPDVVNPSNMAVDHKGRIWLCEVYNYRNEVNNIPYRKSGDRIVILEDTNGDGKTDSRKIFYEGEDVNAALGILVIGEKIIVSCTPNVWVFTDANHDDKPDSKSLLFKTVGGYQSDHGVHSFVYGPDGKLYFNFGNFGAGILDEKNQPVKDIHGREIAQNKKPFQDGMAIKCDLNGKNFEVLGWNFRNNFELCVDAFGRVWQSDNDDDGVRANRINYVLANGNYGYKDEITGADWRVERPNLEDSLFLRHWHQNDPGVIPNLYQTYAGSPTGIVFNEWEGIGKNYQHSIILADAGKNEVNAYHVKPSGSGYSLVINNILTATDNWFRPSDVCFGPDGSLYVADWYDDGVGGHYAGDIQRGRIYRIRKKARQKFKQDIFNPNIDTRFMARNNPEPIASNDYEKARLLWKLWQANPKNPALQQVQSTEELMIAQVNMGLKGFETNASPIVRAVYATKLYLKDAAKEFMSLVEKLNPSDRIGLEALGIAATDHWDTYLPLVLKSSISQEVKNELIWRSRSKYTVDLLLELIKKNTGQIREKYFRALDFQNPESKNKGLLALLKQNPDQETSLLIFKNLDEKIVSANPELTAQISKALPRIGAIKDYLYVVQKYKLKDQKDKLWGILEQTKDKDVYVQVAQIMTEIFGSGVVREVMVGKKTNDEKAMLVDRLGTVDNQAVTRQLISLIQNRQMPMVIRKAATKAMVGYDSDVVLWRLMSVNKLDRELLPEAKFALSQTYHSDLKIAFEQKYGKPKPAANKNLAFLNQKINITNGQVLFTTYCTTCHQNAKEGVDFGPGLKNIGAKLSKEAIYNAIVNPSQGISFGYEGFIFTLKDGSQTQGLITSKTNSYYLIKQPGSAVLQKIEIAKVKEVKNMEESLMPAFSLQNNEYADLVGYLSTLK